MDNDGMKGELGNDLSDPRNLTGRDLTMILFSSSYTLEAHSLSFSRPLTYSHSERVRVTGDGLSFTFHSLTLSPFPLGGAIIAL